MSLAGRLVSSKEVKANGDVFHEIFGHRPHHLVTAFPHIYQSFTLLRGSWGTPGSSYFINFTHEGKKQVVRGIFEALDDNTKTTKYKITEGDIMQLYSSFSISTRVETRGRKTTVTWTLEYVKRSPSVPDPTSLMDLFLTITKGIDAMNSS